MCLKHVGVELPVMMGTHADAHLYILYDGATVCRLHLKPGHLPHCAEMPPEFQSVLDLDKRTPGQHRPLRLVLGSVDREPYHFYTARLPGSGLHFPDGTLGGHLALELWVDCKQPLWHYPVLFHLKGSDPVVHPFGNRVLWKCHEHWTGAWDLGGRIVAREGSPCGCCMRTRIHFGHFSSHQMIPKAPIRDQARSLLKPIPVTSACGRRGGGRPSTPSVPR